MASKYSREACPRRRSKRKGPGAITGGASSDEGIPSDFHRPPGSSEGQIQEEPIFWDRGVSLFFDVKSFRLRTIRRGPDRRRAIWGAWEKSAGPEKSGEMIVITLGDSRNSSPAAFRRSGLCGDTTQTCTREGSSFPVSESKDRTLRNRATFSLESVALPRSQFKAFEGSIPQILAHVVTGRSESSTRSWTIRR